MHTTSPPGPWTPLANEVYLRKIDELSSAAIKHRLHHEHPKMIGLVQRCPWRHGQLLPGAISHLYSQCPYWEPLLRRFSVLHLQIHQLGRSHHVLVQICHDQKRSDTDQGTGHPPKGPRHTLVRAFRPLAPPTQTTHRTPTSPTTTAI